MDPEPFEQPPPTRLSSVAWRRGRDALVVALAVAIGLAVASSLAHRSARIGPLTLSARVAWGWPGETALLLTPFGEAHARTHVGPARLLVSVDAVDVPAVQQLLSSSASRAAKSALPSFQEQGSAAGATVETALADEARKASDQLVMLATIVAVLAAVFAGLVALALLRRWSLAALTATITLTIAVGSGVLAAGTFDPRALSSPHLEGALAYVPQLQTLITTRLSRIERLRAQASDLAVELAAYYADPRSIAPGGGLPGTYRVLHVTDLHLDPVGAELGRSLARSYEASLVIETGDIVILGNQEESSLLPALVVTSTPTLFVPGNHDSRFTTAKLNDIPGVSVPASGTTMVDGLRIYTVPDPLGESLAIGPDPALVDDVTRAAADDLRAAQATGEPPPDIVALHDPRAERDLVGLTPLVLSGHTHSARVYRSDGTVRLNSGTLGGMPFDLELLADYRAGRRMKQLPHSASVLYYTSQPPRKLIAIDRISVGNDRTMSLERVVIDEALLP